MNETRLVGALTPSDRFVWCSRVVTLEKPIAWKYGRRRGGWLVVVDDDGTPHRLHYYADERVVVESSEP